MRVRGRDFEYGDDMPVYRGDIGAIHLPFEPDDAQIAAIEDEIADKLARKRPCGFAPWPDDDARL